MEARRHWYTGLALVPITVAKTLSMFRNHRMGAFVPFLLILFVGSVVLWMINAIAPLAPFVYSLF